MNRPQAALSRRGLVTAAAGAGAVVALAPLIRPSNFAPATSPTATKTAATEGYRLTDHVKRYYQTTLV